ncbi:MAG: hypothetical protein ACYDH9_22595, partial [Limisphaerales bacterium]
MNSILLFSSISPVGASLLFALATSAGLAADYPLAATVVAARQAMTNATVAATVLSRNDYLAVGEGIVDYFRHFQAADGRVIDPFVHREVQYSTPCYAWAAAALVESGRRPELVESAAQALERALQELADGKPADRHGDFFTFPAMLAYEHLREHVAPERRRQWEVLLRAIQPEHAYSDLIQTGRPAVHNWNVVAIAGEFLRNQDGFTDGAFVDRYLEAQLPHFTAEGMYR